MILSIGDATGPLLPCNDFSAKWTSSLFLMYIGLILMDIHDMNGVLLSLVIIFKKGTNQKCEMWNAEEYT